MQKKTKDKCPNTPFIASCKPSVSILKFSCFLLFQKKKEKGISSPSLLLPYEKKRNRKPEFH